MLTVTNKPERFIHAFIFAGAIFLISLHLYTAGMMTIHGVFAELTFPPLMLDLFYGVAIILGFGLLGRIPKTILGIILSTVFYLLMIVLNGFMFEWQAEYFQVFNNFGWINFPVANLFVWIWVGFTAISLILIFYNAMSQLASFRKNDFITTNTANTHKLMSPVLMMIPLILIPISLFSPDWVVQEGTVKRTVILEDHNHTASLAIWDFPDYVNYSAQVPGTCETDPTLLTHLQNRTLTAFGTMNTTFIGRLYFNTEGEANTTAARMKLLQVFGCHAIASIGYLDDDQSFPNASKPEKWIASARRTITFIRQYNLTCVTGITADSEQNAELPREEYNTNIAMYDVFLKEIHTNTSLAHPDPRKGTFDTVLTTGQDAYIDLMDGDLNHMEGNMRWGLPPKSWTHYHFMMYRSDESTHVANMYALLLILKNTMGTQIATPTVGLAGAEWFEEGYYNGTYRTFGKDPQEFQYDGVDGWAAMRREIFMCKALGFQTVSVFHLNAYSDSTQIESIGFLDYGIEKIESLAAEWRVDKTIEIPISSMDTSIGTRGFFTPCEEFQYDLFMNWEMLLFQLAIWSFIVLYTLDLKNRPAKAKNLPQKGSD